MGCDIKPVIINTNIMSLHSDMLKVRANYIDNKYPFIHIEVLSLLADG